MSYKSPVVLLFLEQKTLLHFIFPWSPAYATLRKYDWVIGYILGSLNEIKTRGLPKVYDYKSSISGAWEGVPRGREVTRM